MSDFILCFIPEQPDFLPSVEKVGKLNQTAAELNLEADEVVSKLEDRIVFVDAGENWGKVVCPVCKAQLTDDMVGTSNEFSLGDPILRFIDTDILL